MIDTHAHLYLPEFDEDREKMIAAAQNAGVCRCWIPAIHYDSLQAMEALREKHKDYFDFFAGLHPTEVRENYRQELDLIYKALSENEYKGIGEIGLDLYWDKSFYKEQVDALQVQLHWAVEKDMPVLLHIRNAFDEIMPIIRPYYAKGLRGIFHSFSGNLQQARELTEQGGFLLGIGGSITFKNSLQQSFLSDIPLSHIVTETDSPYLSPPPFRGTRNDPSRIPIIAQFLAKIYHLSEEDVKKQTFENAKCL